MLSPLTRLAGRRLAIETTRNSECVTIPELTPSTGGARQDMDSQFTSKPQAFLDFALAQLCWRGSRRARPGEVGSAAQAEVWAFVELGRPEEIRDLEEREAGDADHLADWQLFRAEKISKEIGGGVCDSGLIKEVSGRGNKNSEFDCAGDPVEGAEMPPA